MPHARQALYRSGRCTDACLFAVVLSALLPVLQLFNDELLYRRHLVQAGEFWRIWTGSLVHTNAWHLAINLAGLWILVFLDRHSLGRFAMLAHTFFLTTCVGAGLWLMSPEVMWYAGFSGTLYGLFMLSGINLLAQRKWLTAALVLVGICGKTLWDWQQGSASASSPLIEAPVIYAAHIYGMTGGLLLGFPSLLRFMSRP